MKNHFYQKLLAFVLIALVGLMPQLPSLATMHNGEVNLSAPLEGTPIYGAFLYKDTLYSLADDVLLKQKGDSNEFEGVAKLQYAVEKKDENGQVIEPQGNMLVDGEALYFINNTGLYTTELQDKTLLLKELLPLKINEEEGYIDTYNAQVQDGKLYLLHSSNEGESSIMVYSLGESTPKTHKLPEDAGYPMGFGDYKEGIYVFTERKILSFGEAGFQEIFVFPEGTYLESSSLAYIPAEDAFYFTRNSYLMRIQNDKVEPIKVLDSIPNFLVGMHDGRIFLGSPVEAGFLDPKTAKLPEKVLKIHGIEDQRILSTYNKLHPEMPAVRSYDYNPDAVSFTNAMKGENKADIYLSDIFVYVDDLIRHEFIEPLDDVPELKAAYDRMYPYVQKSLERNGKLMLMPYNVFSYGMVNKLSKYTYNAKIWEDLGLTEKDVPKTYLEFVRLLDRIHSEHHEELQADNTPIIQYPYSLAHDLKLRALNLCAINAKINGVDPKFDTPEMNELLQAIDKSGYMEMTRDEAYLSEMGDSEFSLFKETEDIIDLPRGYVPFNLTIGENDQPYTLATSTVAFVNALSDNKTEAKAFLVHMMKELNARTQTYLYTDLNEPVSNPEVQRYIAIQESFLKKAEEELEKAKAEGAKNIKWLEQEKESFETNLRQLKEHTMLLSAEEIAVLNQDAPYIIIISENLFDWNNEQMSLLMDRLYQNDMPAKEFLAELDRIVNMMRLEGK